MLSEDQKNVLVLLRDLSHSALFPNEQTGYVTLINEAILKLEDDVEEARLLGLEVSENESFVTLARWRLVEAQKSARCRFNERRLSKVSKLLSANDTDLNSDAILSDTGPVIESEEEIAQGVRETKSENITKVLQRMHELAQAEILKGELNLSELDMSSKTLRELQEKYSGVDILLNGSRRLVKVLDEADKWDRLCMQASLGFLALVLVYIIYRRILSGPVKIILWSLFQFVGLVKWVAPKNSLQPQLSVPQHNAQSTLADMVSNRFVPEPSTATKTIIPEESMLDSLYIPPGFEDSTGEINYEAHATGEIYPHHAEL